MSSRRSWWRRVAQGAASAGFSSTGRASLPSTCGSCTGASHGRRHERSRFVDPEDIEFAPDLPLLPNLEQIVEAMAEPAPDPVGATAVAADGPVFVDLREREMRDVHWHDRPFLPAGELVTNNADGDTGKGLIAVHYAARFSRGEFGDRRMVVFAVAEDDFETVLKPRLVAAEANLAVRPLCRLAAQGHRRRVADPRRHAGARAGTWRPMDVGLFVIDPLLSHLSAKTNTPRRP